jgi:hypothetical protein
MAFLDEEEPSLAQDATEIETNDGMKSDLNVSE